VVSVGGQLSMVLRRYHDCAQWQSDDFLASDDGASTTRGGRCGAPALTTTNNKIVFNN